MARSHTETAVRTLAGVMQQKDAPPSARVSAAAALLDRGWGKPESNLNITGKLESHIIQLIQGLDVVVEDAEVDDITFLDAPDDTKLN